MKDDKELRRLLLGRRRAGEFSPFLSRATHSRELLNDPRKYSLVGSMAFADRLRWGRESHPLRLFRVAGNLMVKPNIGGAGMALLWVRRWVGLPLFPPRGKYCLNGAWPSPTGCEWDNHRTPAAPWVAANRMVKPSVEGCGNGAPLGAEMGRSALADARSTATTGAWPSRTVRACEGM